MRQTGEPQDVLVGESRLDGCLVLPPKAEAIVLFAHGSGSSRHSPRNRSVATVLQSAGLATLLFDLLTAAEEAVDEVTGWLRFDIQFLCRRLVSATRWVQDLLPHHRIGYFGASTGAAAALEAAAQLGDEIGAIVSRGGRPDLAVEAAHLVRAPTLLIVGERDIPVIEMNRSVLPLLRVPKDLQIVPGATHLFEETGALERAATLARDWFLPHLARPV